MSAAATSSAPLPAGRGRRVARDSALSMVALVVLGGTRVVYGSIVSRVTDHATFGTIGVLLALTMIASYVLPAGIGSATSRFVPFARGSGEPALARGFHRLLARSANAAAPILGLAAGLVVRFVLGWSMEESVETGLLAAAYSLYTTEKAALYGFGKVASYVRLEILGSALTLASTLVIVAVRGWYLLPFVIGYGVFVIGARWVVRAEARGTVAAPTSADRRELAVYVALACAGTVASAGFLQGTQLMAARYARASDVAYFAAVVTLITPLYFLPRALALALFPFLSEAHGAGEVDVIRRHTDVSTRGLLALLAPVIVVAELLAGEIMTIFGGATYAGGAVVLQVMLVAAFIAIVQVASVNALSSGPGWQLRVPVGWAVSGFIVGIVVVVLVGGPLGAIGVAVAYLVGTFVTAAGPIVVVWRRYGMAWTGPFARAVMAVAAGAAAAQLLGEPSTAFGPGWVLHAGVAVVGGLLALGLLWPDLSAILAVVRRQSPGRARRAGPNNVPILAIADGPDARPPLEPD